MDMGPLLDSVLGIKYSSDSGDKERRKAKRTEKFVSQVEEAVARMKVDIPENLMQNILR